MRQLARDASEGASSSLIVPRPCPSAIVAPTGPLRTSEKVSSAFDQEIAGHGDADLAREGTRRERRDTRRGLEVAARGRRPARSRRRPSRAPGRLRTAR